MSANTLRQRVQERIQDWNITIQDTLETQSSFLAFGIRANQPVVLKVIRQPGDEWHCGKVLQAFDGKGMVRAYQYVDGAVLLERLRPGTSLATMSLNGLDEEATVIIAEVIKRLKPLPASLNEFITNEFVTVADWGKGFSRYLASRDRQISRQLVERGERLYTELCATQQSPRLLHGDLQHYNILLDSQRGWTAIDPKGVVGEIEYEIGASLRNPYEKPDLFASAQIVERRLKIYEKRLTIDYHRALRWGYAQAILSAIWGVEDGFTVDEQNQALRLAKAIEPLVV